MKTIITTILLLSAMIGSAQKSVKTNPAFTFPLEPADIFADRTGQFISSGIPQQVLEKAKQSIDDMWRDGPGGWVYEWSALAAKAEKDGDFLLASLIYGCAKYPCLFNQSKREAYQKQIQSFLKASEKFSYRFERKTEMVSYRGITTPVVYHIIYTANPEQSPVLILSGGVDTYKIDVHERGVALAKAVDANIVMIDMPGTGESQVALAPDNDELYKNFVAEIRPVGNGKVGYIGFSYGGYWAARLAFEHIVDAAVAAGAPMNDAFLNEGTEKGTVLQPKLGMRGVLSYAFKLDGLAPDSVLQNRLKTFSLSRLGLSKDIQTAPLILFNGDHDPYIPESDIMNYKGIKNIEVKIVPNSGHCAAPKTGEIMPWVVKWLKTKLN